MHGGPGNDQVFGAGRIYGDSGDDYMVFAFETSPGAGDGLASGGSGSDHVCVNGDSGRDRVSGESSNSQYVDCGSAYDSYAADATDTVRPNCENEVGHP